MSENYPAVSKDPIISFYPGANSNTLVLFKVTRDNLHGLWIQVEVICVLWMTSWRYDVPGLNIGDWLSCGISCSSSLTNTNAVMIYHNPTLLPFTFSPIQPSIIITADKWQFDQEAIIKTGIHVWTESCLWEAKTCSVLTCENRSECNKTRLSEVEDSMSTLKRPPCTRL